MTSRRSCLSVPGSAPRMLAKAASLPADEVVIDLEDAVAPAAKGRGPRAACRRPRRGDASRRTVGRARERARQSPWCDADLVARWPAGSPRWSFPRSRAPGLAESRSCSPLGGRRTGLQALVETAAGLPDAARSPRPHARLDALILGYADLRRVARAPAGAGKRPSGGGTRRRPCSWPRAPPASRRSTGPTCAIRDEDGLRRGAEHARALGFDGKWAVHPDQVDRAINAAFTPARARARARRRDRGRAWRAAHAGAVRAGRRDDRRGEPQAGARGAWSAAARRGRMSAGTVRVGGPWFEDFERGQVFDDAPGADPHRRPRRRCTRRIAGDRLRLRARRRAVPRGDRAETRRSPIPTWSATWRSASRPAPTQRVRGNLFYRGLVLRAPVFVGDTLRTRTEVVGLKQNRAGRRHRHRPGRAADPDRRPARRAGARLLALPDDPAARPGGRRPATPTTSTTIPRDARRRRGSSAALPDGWDLDALRDAAPGPALRRRSTPGLAFEVEARRDGDRARRSWRGSRSTWRWRTPTPRGSRTGAGSSTAATRSRSPPRTRRGRSRRS